ncbi:cortical protein marker for cell polarity-domain-containing protein [Xylaria acuta]|nr:cortical protein marker for cell polarity-domain-containing protein [Xylaria acuta]
MELITSQWHKYGLGLLGLIFVLPAYAFNLTIPAPELELSTIGRLAFTGDFDAAFIYNFHDSIISSSGTTDQGTLGGRSIRAQLPDGTFSTLVDSNAAIKHMCLFSTGSKNQSAAVVVAGNFTELAGLRAPSVALLNYKTGDVTPLPSIEGQVEAVLCDTDNSAIYMATSTTANLTNAIARIETTGWKDLPFEGTNGKINTIEKSPTGSILFGGSFNSLGTGVSATSLDITLNGLLEWNNSQGLSESSIYTPLVNATLELDPGANINKLLTLNNSVFVCGNFTGAGIQNIFLFEDGRVKALSAGGLNGPVTTVVHLPSLDMLIFGGEFTGTSNRSIDGLNNLAGYSFHDRQWHALGAGVSGQVNSLNALSLNVSDKHLEPIVIVNGLFDQLLAFSNNESVSVDGIGAWVPSENNWLPNIDMLNRPIMEGSLTATVDTPGNVTLFTGTLSSWPTNSNGAVGIYDSIDSTVLYDLGLQMRADSSGANNSVRAGLLYQDGPLNLTILGGSFTAETTNSSPIHNIAILDGSQGDKILGLPEFAPNAIIQCLQIGGQTLFLGGIFQQPVEGQIVHGLVVYDFVERTYTKIQPPTLGGDAVHVEVMSARPDSPTVVYVGGTFDTAGGNDCHSVCAYDTSTSTWTRPGSNLGGTVRFMTWTGFDSLVVSGNITVDGTPVALATYYVPDDKWVPFNTLQPLKGTVTAMTQASVKPIGTEWSSDGVGFWIAGRDSDGSAFLKKWESDRWLNVMNGFASKSRIQDLQVLSLKKPISSNDFLNGNQVLLVVGDVVLPGLGSFSATLFNGIDFIPYIATKTAAGEAGTITSIVTERTPFFVAAHESGVVIVIAVPILAVLFSIILVGELENWWYQRRLKLAARLQAGPPNAASADAPRVSGSEYELAYSDSSQSRIA